MRLATDRPNTLDNGKDGRLARYFPLVVRHYNRVMSKPHTRKSALFADRFWDECVNCLMRCDRSYDPSSSASFRTHLRNSLPFAAAMAARGVRRHFENLREEDAELAICRRKTDDLDEWLEFFPHRDRPMIEMTHRKGMYQSEIAVEMGCVEQTVHNRLKAAYALARKRITTAGLATRR